MLAEIIKAEAGRRSETINELGKRLFKDGGAVTRIITGEQLAPPSKLLKLVSDFEVHACKHTLRVWLSAFVEERFGPDVARLFKRAGLCPSEEDLKVYEERVATGSACWS